MKKAVTALILLALCLALLVQTGVTKTVDYTPSILGVWYVVEYENEFVEFRADGTVVDTFGSDVTYGDYLVDNENALLWVNFGDDIFTIRIAERDGEIILLDNNGTLVRERKLGKSG